MTKKRIVMANGGIRSVISTTCEEKELLEHLIETDDYLLRLRDDIRKGHNLV
jgi:hypothetical protein